MAITGFSTTTGGLMLATAIGRFFHENVVDRTNLMGVATYYGNINETASPSHQIGTVTINEPMAATTEGSAPTPTELTDGAATITVARQSFSREITDLLQMINIYGPLLGPQAFGQQMGLHAALRFTDLLTALFTSITAFAGTSGASLTVDGILDAMYTLNAALAEPPYYFVAHNAQYNEFIDDLRSVGNGNLIYQSSEALGEIARAKGPGFQGILHNINIYRCDSVGTASSNYVGCMFDKMAFGWKDGDPSAALQFAEQGSTLAAMPEGSPVLVEFKRKAEEGTTVIIGSHYVGTGIMEQARACRVISGT